MEPPCRRQHRECLCRPARNPAAGRGAGGARSRALWRLRAVPRGGPSSGGEDARVRLDAAQRAPLGGAEGGRVLRGAPARRAAEGEAAGARCALPCRNTRLRPALPLILVSPGVNAGALVLVPPWADAELPRAPPPPGRVVVDISSLCALTSEARRGLLVPCRLDPSLSQHTSLREAALTAPRTHHQVTNGGCDDPRVEAWSLRSKPWRDCVLAERAAPLGLRERLAGRELLAPRSIVGRFEARAGAVIVLAPPAALRQRRL